jgi:riboflavin kinase / FMN adenylyltransferase
MNARVFFSLEAAADRFGPCSLAIGNFDGVHMGHQALLAAAGRFVSNMRMNPAVLTFHPHPAVFVAPTRVPPMICSLRQRLRLLEAAGVQRILVLPFNRDVARLSPEEFVRDVVVKGLQAKAVFVGENFRFGYQQAGTPEVLRGLGEQYDFVTHFVKPISFRGQVVSSSGIRRLLALGNARMAGRMLGRCFSLEGPVVSGRGIGSQQTVPTLNLDPPAGQIIPRGVYVTETIEAGTGRRWPSITNAGVRPTFGGEHLAIETFLLAPLEGDTPREISVQFRRFIRAEQQFPNATALKEQIMRDVARAQAYWRRLSTLSSPGLSPLGLSLSALGVHL